AGDMSLASGTGLISGIDDSSLISKLIQADSQPIYLAQNKESKIKTKQSAMQGINRLLLEFKTKVEAIGKPSNFIKMNASSTDANMLMANASTDAVAGTYTARVRQLAQAERIASQGYATMDKTSIAETSGSFTFNVGGDTATSIDVTSGMSLQDLRDAINNADAGVRASIVNDGTATNPYRLVLTSSETGASNTINITRNDTTVNLQTSTIEAAAAADGNQFDGTVTSSGTYTGTSTRNTVVQITTAGDVGTAKYKVSLDGGLTWTASDAFTTSATATDITGTAAEGIQIAFGAGTQSFVVGDRFTIDAFAPQLQKAQDSIIEVDGIQVSRDNNTFEDVIPGVTLTAKQVTATDDDPVTITVANQKATISGAVQEFVTAYNALVQEISTQTAYNTKTQTAAALFGDSGLRNLVSSFRQSITQSVKGLSSNNSLSSVGITFGKDGKLSLDLTKLTKALDNDSDAVMRLFVESGKSAYSTVQLNTTTSKTQIGTYNVVVTTPASQATVTGTQTVATSGISAAETLTFAYGEESMNVTLSAGMTLSQVITKLNDQFEANGYDLEATDDGGKLKVHTREYGDEEKFSMSSPMDAAAAGQLGIGTTKIDAVGVDVAGTIAGVKATGKGQVLTSASSGASSGLALTITATAPLTTSFTVSRGVAWDVLNQITNATDSDTGLFSVRDKSYDTQIEDIEKQIETLQSRLDTEETNLNATFTALEQKLASLQQQGNSLTSQLSSLISTTSSSS
ncbi:flagellar filament capping protein FliD, partial [bacterium]|nr:flagellar filament capping protein FliD [bacterium]